MSSDRNCYVTFDEITARQAAPLRRPKACDSQLVYTAVRGWAGVDWPQTTIASLGGLSPKISSAGGFLGQKEGRYEPCVRAVSLHAHMPRHHYLHVCYTVPRTPNVSTAAMAGHANPAKQVCRTAAPMTLLAVP